MRLLLILLMALIPHVGLLQAEEIRPDPKDIKEFVADPITGISSAQFKDFVITQKELGSVLRDYHQVEEDHWLHPRLSG